MYYSAVYNNWSFRKCQGSQQSFRWCSAMILPNLSHFDMVKKMVQVLESWREQSLGRLSDVPMTAPSNFQGPAPFFLPYQNGSILVESLLSPVSSYAENPSDFSKKVTRLLHSGLEIENFAKSKQL